VVENTNSDIIIRDETNPLANLKLPTIITGLCGLGGFSFEPSIELALLPGCLEATVSKLGRCIDKLEIYCLHRNPSRLWNKRLPQRHNTLLWTHTATLYHQVIIFHNTVVWKSSHWCYILLGPVKLGDGRMRLQTNLTKLIDLLVHLCSMMVAILPSPSNSK